jgi:hypothetical protein
MGIFDGMLGHASEIDATKLEDDFGNILGEGERIEHAYKVLRDLVVFTNKRLVFVNKQGVTGKKVEYHTIPYKSISHFSVETTGHFDMDAELKIWISGVEEPFQRDFSKNGEVIDIQKALATYVLK